MCIQPKPAAVPAAIVLAHGTGRVEWLTEYLRLTEDEPLMQVAHWAYSKGFTPSELQAAHKAAVHGLRRLR